MTLRCSNVGVAYGGKTILSDVSLALAPGRVLGIVGPNGAGKSTLLRVLAAQTRPDRGAVRLGERDAFSIAPRELARTRALLPQHFEVVFEFTVRELVLLGRTPHAQVETAACRAVVERCLERVGLGQLAELSVGSLSGGERQRAHLARVMAQIGLDPAERYLLLDEPVANQDPGWQLRILEQVTQLAASNAGVAVVLHDLDLAARACDQLVLMAEGRVVCAGAPREVLHAETLAKVFDVEVHVDDDPWDPSLVRVSFRRSPRV